MYIAIAVLDYSRNTFKLIQSYIVVFLYFDCYDMSRYFDLTVGTF